MGLKRSHMVILAQIRQRQEVCQNVLHGSGQTERNSFQLIDEQREQIQNRKSTYTNFSKRIPVEYLYRITNKRAYLSRLLKFQTRNFVTKQRLMLLTKKIQLIHLTILIRRTRQNISVYLSFVAAASFLSPRKSFHHLVHQQPSDLYLSGFETVKPCHLWRKYNSLMIFKSYCYAKNRNIFNLTFYIQPD